MASVDFSYRFTIVDIGAFGRESDAGVFAACEFGKALDNRNLSIPAPQRLSSVKVTNRCFCTFSWEMMRFLWNTTWWNCIPDGR